MILRILGCPQQSTMNTEFKSCLEHIQTILKMLKSAIFQICSRMFYNSIIPWKPYSIYTIN